LDNAGGTLKNSRTFENKKSNVREFLNLAIRIFFAGEEWIKSGDGQEKLTLRHNEG